MSENQLEKEVRERLAEWDVAREEHDELRSRYFAVGSHIPGQSIRWAEKLNDEAWEKLDQAEAKEKSAEKRWNEAIERWRPRRQRKPE